MRGWKQGLGPYKVPASPLTLFLPLRTCGKATKANTLVTMQETVVKPKTTNISVRVNHQTNKYQETADVAEQFFSNAEQISKEAQSTIFVLFNKHPFTTGHLSVY